MKLPFVKSKLDDQLLLRAFGELDGPEADRLAKKLEKSPKLRAEAEKLDQAACKLNLLKEIPEPQLSTERLRDALLGQGLRRESPAPDLAPRKPVTATLGWVAAAAVLGTLAVAVAKLLNPGAVAAHRPSNPAHEGSAQYAQLQRKADAKPVAATVNLNAATLASNKHASLARREPPKGRSHRLNPDEVPAKQLESPITLPESFGTPTARLAMNQLQPGGSLSNANAPAQNGQAQNGQAPAGKAVTTKRNDVRQSPKRRLVVIDGEDDATGLPKAQEVADVGHVVLTG